MRGRRARSSRSSSCCRQRSPGRRCTAFGRRPAGQRPASAWADRSASNKRSDRGSRRRCLGWCSRSRRHTPSRCRPDGARRSRSGPGRRRRARARSRARASSATRAWRATFSTRRGSVLTQSTRVNTAVPTREAGSTVAPWHGRTSSRQSSWHGRRALAGAMCDRMLYMHARACRASSTSASTPLRASELCGAARTNRASTRAGELPAARIPREAYRRLFPHVREHAAIALVVPRTNGQRALGAQALVQSLCRRVFAMSVCLSHGSAAPRPCP